jgi:hypothetical protein
MEGYTEVFRSHPAPASLKRGSKAGMGLTRAVFRSHPAPASLKHGDGEVGFTLRKPVFRSHPAPASLKQVGLDTRAGASRRPGSGLIERNYRFPEPPGSGLIEAADPASVGNARWLFSGATRLRPH